MSGIGVFYVCIQATVHCILDLRLGSSKLFLALQMDLDGIPKAIYFTSFDAIYKMSGSACELFMDHLDCNSYRLLLELSAFQLLGSTGWHTGEK